MSTRIPLSFRLATVLVLAFLLSPTIARAAVESRAVPISYGKVDGQEVIGECVLFYDPNITTPRAAILVFPEWWGLNDYSKGRARQLADLGYVTLAVDVYGGARATKDFDEAGKLSAPFREDRKLLRQRAAKALEILKKLREVDGKRVAALGYCFGGTAALELARDGADLAGVVSFHGDLSNPHPKDAEGIKGKVLLLHGAVDPLVPAKAVAAFLDEMNAAKVDYVFVAYANAVHAFTNPNAGSDPTKGIAYNQIADRRSWEAMREFLRELFAK